MNAIAATKNFWEIGHDAANPGSGGMPTLTSQMYNFIENSPDSETTYENIILKVVDFGIAGMKQGGRTGEKSTAGTTVFMAPEVLNETDTSATKALDIWAVGIILYLMVFGYHPFKTKDKDQTLKNILEMRVKFPPEVACTPECKDLIRNMLMKNPKRRISMFKILNHRWFELEKDYILNYKEETELVGTYLLYNSCLYRT